MIWHNMTISPLERLASVTGGSSAALAIKPITRFATAFFNFAWIESSPPGALYLSRTAALLRTALALESGCEGQMMRGG